MTVSCDACEVRLCQSQLERYEKLFQKWLANLAKAGKAVERHGKKVAYYRKRLDDLNEADRRAAAAALAVAEAAAAQFANNRDSRQFLLPAVNNNQTPAGPPWGPRAGTGCIAS